ncbi:LacI family DNA-binding transcriptional regulator [Lachnospiraceae bacterium ZAX-1]
MENVVKLKDIAHEVGVSVVTVSNALAGKRGVSAQIRERVISKANEMGYDVSKYDKKESRAVKIGVIVSEKYLEVGTSFYWDMYQQVAYETSRKQGFTIFEILEKNKRSQETLPQVLKEETIDGLIVIGWVEKRLIERIVFASKVPIVLLDFYDVDVECDCVMSNNYIGMYKATRYLLDRGHRDIAFVGSIRANDNIMDRYFGYRKGLAESGMELREEWRIEDRNIDTGEMKPLHLPSRMPTAFVCNSDFTAGLLYDELTKNGYRIPEDVSIVGYDNYLYGHPFADEITTYNVDMEKMAKAAVNILFKQMKKNSKHQGIRYIDSDIVERNSVRCL